MALFLVVASLCLMFVEHLLSSSSPVFWSHAASSSIPHSGKILKTARSQMARSRTETPREIQRSFSTTSNNFWCRWHLPWPGRMLPASECVYSSMSAAGDKHCPRLVVFAWASDRTNIAWKGSYIGWEPAPSSVTVVVVITGGRWKESFLSRMYIFHEMQRFVFRQRICSWNGTGFVWVFFFGGGRGVVTKDHTFT